MSAIFTYVASTRLMKESKSVSTAHNLVITACKTSCVFVLSETVKHSSVYSVFGFSFSRVVTLSSISHNALIKPVK